MLWASDAIDFACKMPFICAQAASKPAMSDNVRIERFVYPCQEQPFVPSPCSLKGTAGGSQLCIKRGSPLRRREKNSSTLPGLLASRKTTGSEYPSDA